MSEVSVSFAHEEQNLIGAIAEIQFNGNMGGEAGKFVLLDNGCELYRVHYTNFPQFAQHVATPNHAPLKMVGYVQNISIQPPESRFVIDVQAEVVRYGDTIEQVQIPANLEEILASGKHLWAMSGDEVHLATWTGLQGAYGVYKDKKRQVRMTTSSLPMLITFLVRYTGINPALWQTASAEDLKDSD